MAGHLVYDYLKIIPKYIVEGTFHSNSMGYNLDVSVEANVLAFFENHTYDWVINCIGSLVKASEDNPLMATRINSVFPRLLEKVFMDTNTRLIHISTDCVFSGKDGKYTELSQRDGYDIYAKTKAIGEIINDKDLTLRTSIIGPNSKANGNGLFDWFIKQTGKVNGYNNHLWGGVTTLELAKVIEYCIQNPIHGLVNVTNGISISKLELLREFNKIWKNNRVQINETDDLTSIDKSLISMRGDFNYTVPGYHTMLLELKEYMDLNKNKYNAYY